MYELFSFDGSTPFDYNEITMNLKLKSIGFFLLLFGCLSYSIFRCLTFQIFLDILVTAFLCCTATLGPWWLLRFLVAQRRSDHSGHWIVVSRLGSKWVIGALHGGEGEGEV